MISPQSSNRLISICGIVTLCAISYGVSSAAFGDPASGAAADAPTESTLASPLDTVPGLGKGAAAIQRDEAIAFWEAYHRQVAMATCMGERGFAYEPERGGFNGGDAKRTLEYLGEDPADAGIEDRGASFNVAYRADLSDGRLDDYWEAFYGLTSQQLREQANPPGTGCADQSHDAPSIWDVRDAIGDEQLQLYLASHEGDRMKTTASAFSECARDLGAPPGSSRLTYEQHVLDATTLVAIERVCLPAYDAVRDRELETLETEFVENDPRLDAQQAMYSNVRTVIRQDADFMALLRQ